MNKRHDFAGGRTLYRDLPSVVILAVCFLFGLCFGCLMASIFQKGGDPHLFSFLEEYFLALEKGGKTHVTLFSIIWEFLQWPLLAYLIGSTLFGVIALPVMICLRGFLLSYAISILVSLYGGWRGFLLSICIFGAQAFSSVVILFLIGMLVLQKNKKALKGKNHKWQSRSIITICLIWIAAGIFLQRWICPALLRRLASLL